MPAYNRFEAPSDVQGCLDYFDVHLGYVLASNESLPLPILQKMCRIIHAEEVIPTFGDGNPNSNGGDGVVSFLTLS